MDTTEQSPPRRMLPILSAVTFTGFLDTTLLVPIMALYAEELGAGIGITGLIIGLYSIVNTPANIFFGRLIDQMGHKVLLILGLLGDALAMGLYTLCRLPLHLALVRVFHGLTGAVVGPATMSAITSYSAVEREGRAMGIYGMAIAAANLVGFGISGVLYSRLGHDWLFFFGAAMLMAGAGISFWLPAVKGKAQVSGVISSGSLSAVKTLMKRRGLVVAYGSIFAQYFGFGGVVTLLPRYVVDSLGMDAFHVGMLLTVFSVAFIIVQFPSGALSDRRGRLLPIVTGLCLGIASLVILPMPEGFPLLAVVMALYGLAYGLIFPSISALVADHSRPEERGIATGIFHALLTAGVAIGAPVMGWVAELLGVQVGLMLSPVIMVLSLALAVTLLPKRGT
ncbi:MAG: MFS transporter [Dehalococcoidales bacterium]|nr:MAG: MFS transporter [Dehalococcoidales bacterium]